MAIHELWAYGSDIDRVHPDCMFDLVREQHHRHLVGVTASGKMAESLSELGLQIAFEIRAGLREESYCRVDVLAVNCFHDRHLNGVILRVTGRAE